MTTHLRKSVLVAAVGLGCLAAGLFSFDASARSERSDGESVGDRRRSSASAAAQLSKTFGDVADAIRRSVVSVSAVQRAAPRSMRAPLTQNPLQRFFDQGWVIRPAPGVDEPVRQGLGSGFIVDHDGHVVTNHHVIGDAGEVRVTLWDGRVRDARVVGSDPQTDLAVLQIDAADLVPVEFGDSDALRVGEWVVAAGNPFGLSSTITTGIVSAMGRARMGITDYEYFIQTDAAINPGNSGGPLVDLEGKVVGINSAIFTRHGGNMGIGFAIPASLAGPIIDSIIRTGEVVRGFLGVVIQDVDDGLAASFGFDGAGGALVGDVNARSPALDAGIRRGDIITRFDGEPVDNVAQLRIRVAATEPGRNVAVEVFRDHAYEELDVRVGELEAKGGLVRVPARTELGWSLGDLTPNLRRSLGLPSDTRGVVVTRVVPESPVARAGLDARDVIVEVGGRDVHDLDDLEDALADADDGARLTLLRDGGHRYVFLRLSR